MSLGRITLLLALLVLLRPVGLVTLGWALMKAESSKLDSVYVLQGRSAPNGGSSKFALRLGLSPQILRSPPGNSDWNWLTLGKKVGGAGLNFGFPRVVDVHDRLVGLAFNLTSLQPQIHTVPKRGHVCFRGADLAAKL